MAVRNPVRLLLHVPVPWVFVLTYLAGVGIEIVHPSAIPRAAIPAATIAGAVLLAFGVATACWSLGIFRKAHTTTVPGRTSNALVSWGPYRFTRNPMYVSLACAYLGEAGLLKQLWPVALLPLTLAYVHWIVIPLEESRLQEVFGPDYDRYRATVSRWLGRVR
jgi:protein-S-isoprenylcysteine O-methyltransferase Ste14